MDVRQSPQESLWRTARLYLLTRSRKILFAMAIGLITITTGTTYCIIKYRKKRREELALKLESAEEFEEAESIDRTQPTDREGKPYSLSISAKSDASSTSAKSVDSSYSEKVAKSTEKDDKKGTKDDLVRTRYVEMSESEREAQEGDEKTRSNIEVKDILPSISLEDRSERALLPRQEEASPSSISVSMPRMRIPRKPPVQSTKKPSGNEEIEGKAGSGEKAKAAESQESGKRASKEKEKEKSKEKSGNGRKESMKQQKLKAGSKTSSKKGSRKTPAKSTSSWTFKNVGKKRPKGSKQRQKKKKKPKEKGTKSKKKSKLKPKQKSVTLK